MLKKLLTLTSLFITSTVISARASEENSNPLYVPDNIYFIGVFAFFSISFATSVSLWIALNNRNNTKIFIFFSVATAIFFILDIALVIFLSIKYIAFAILFILLVVAHIFFLWLG